MKNRKKKSILLVEDETDIRELLQEFLQSEGFTAFAATNGQEALDLLRSMTELPGLLVIDLMMPIMDGFAFREEQLRDPTLAAIPVVVMTANVHIKDKAMKLKACDFIKKPVQDIDQVLALATTYCS